MATSTTTLLEQDYRDLLARFGLSEAHPRRLERLRAGVDRVAAAERTSDPDFDPALITQIEAELAEEASEGASLLRGLVLDLASEVEPYVGHFWPDFSQPVLAREFPTGSFNAEARRESNGVLLLLNEGLCMFIHQVLLILGYALQIDDGDRDLLPDGEILEQLTYASLYYLNTKDARTARRLPPLGGPKGLLIADVRHECEKFVLAHEYGHAVAGHLERQNSRTIRCPHGELEVIEKNWSEEFLADLNGLRLVLADLDALSDEKSKRRALRVKISGIFFFFALDHFLDKVESAKSGYSSTVSGSRSHPPALTRLNAIFEKLCEDYERRLVFSSGPFNALLETRGEQVAEAVRMHLTKGDSKAT